MAQPLLIRGSAMDKRLTASFGLWLGLFLTLSASSTFAAYEEVTVTNGATIRGSIKVQGQLPKLPPLQISKYKERPDCDSAPV